jgi:hypothetical protein
VCDTLIHEHALPHTEYTYYNYYLPPFSLVSLGALIHFDTTLIHMYKCGIIHTYTHSLQLVVVKNWCFGSLRIAFCTVWLV